MQPEKTKQKEEALLQEFEEMRIDTTVLREAIAEPPPKAPAKRTRNKK